MIRRADTKAVEGGLRELARGDATTPEFRMTLHHELLQQATTLADGSVGHASHAMTDTMSSRGSNSLFRDCRPAAMLRLLPRWGIVLIAMVLVVAIAATSYATEPAINQIFDRSPDTNQPLGQALDLSQTVNGYTLTLQRAYADRQFVIIGYAVSGPGGRIINGLQPVSDTSGAFALPSLTDGQGHQMQTLGGGGYNEEATTTYSGADIPADATQITLHLKATAMQMPAPHHSQATVNGPWEFTFTIPVAPSRIAEPQQTVADEHGWAVTLERVAITPTQFGVTLRGAGTEASVELIAGGKHFALTAPGGVEGGSVEMGRAIKGCFAEARQCPDLWKDYSAVYGESADIMGGHVGKAVAWAKELQNQRGEWTLIVTESAQPGKLFQPRGGPWIFHFTMP